ncbi:MAG: hypothetical protein GY896_10815 [Gammaproteobacteria bacterium]|nr:hypothetical protein [Gammaproteobacteria bacterium]
MKITTWICLICCISFTGSALAFNSQVTAGTERWTWSEEYEEDSGFTSEGDYTQKEIFAGYTYFLTPVEDNGKSLDLLPFFFSRSSYVYGNFYTGGWDFEDDGSDYTSEKDWTGLGVGGFFYFAPSTGIGGGFFSQDGDWEDNDAVEDDTYDEDRQGWNVSLRHYLNDYNRLSVRLSQTDRERDYANGFERTDKYQWLVLSYAGVLGQNSNIFLGADIGEGSRDKDDSNDNEVDHDRTRYGITVGPVYRYFAIYFSWDYYEWDPKGDAWEAEETFYTISPRYWFSEQLMLGGDLTLWSWDESGDDYDFEESGTGIEIKARYRF